MIRKDNFLSGGLESFCRWIDALNMWTGRIVQYLILISMLTITYEVVSRYVFNSPTEWVTELNIYLLCAYVLLGGGVTLLGKRHVRVDIFWGNISKRNQAILDLITSIFFFAFVVALVWKGFEMFARSYTGGTTSSEAMGWLLYPSQAMVPLGGILLGLQGIAKLYRDLQTILEEKN